MQRNLIWTPFASLLRREISRYYKASIQTIATPLISIALYLFIFGLSLGREISLEHTSYLNFLIPGLVCMAAVRNAFDNTSGSISVSKFCGELEDIKVVPLSRIQIIMAHGIGGLSRGVTVGILSFVLGSCFLLFEQHQLLGIVNLPALIFFLLFGCLSFANLGLATGLLARSFEHVSAITSFLLMPLIYLGGVFFSLDQLSPFWQKAAQLNPLLFVVDGVRYSILGSSDINPLLGAMVTFSFYILTTLFAFWSLKKGSFQRF